MRAVIKFFGAILLCCIVVSCSSIKSREITTPNKLRLGAYITNNVYKSPNYEEIVLKKNQRMTYTLKFETTGNQLLHGKWNLQNDTLKLLFKIPKNKEKGKVKITYGTEKRCALEVKINDKVGPLFGCKLFVNDIEYAISSNNIKVPSQFIKKFKVIYNSETYEKVINKYIDRDVTFLIELFKYRSPVYEIFTTEWLVKDDKLYRFKDGQLFEKAYLQFKN